MENENYLVISDLQIPFHDPDALKFCRYVQRHFKIPLTNILNVGDELDQYWGGLWDKSPDAAHTANQEIQESRDTLLRWYSAFPEMRLCLSNHGSRWMRKALHSQIPSQLLRSYRDIINAPEGWQWAKYWKIDTKHPFLMEHGDDWGGQTPHIAAMMHNGISTVMGHHHSKFGVHFMKTGQQYLWGAVAGSLIDFDQYAFEYARSAKLKPVSGVVVVLNSGRMPLLVPKN